jgi:membrane-associated phospholipid phosphatase
MAQPYPCPPPTDPFGPWPPPPAPIYNLRGRQVEPDASYWTIEPCPVPCVVRVSDLTRYTDDPRHPCYFPPYPDDATTRQEIDELRELACLRDDPEAVFGGPPERRRLGLSPFMQLTPQPIGAVYNRLRRPDSTVINDVPERADRASCSCASPSPDHCAPNRGDSFPVIRTGRELARYFEGEAPGLAHRNALNYLLRDAGLSPPRQALIGMALDLAIYSALAAAWYYKWSAGNGEVPGPCRPQGKRRDRVARRPRPVEFDYRVDVLYNRAVNCHGSGDGDRRQFPSPSPGTPRHPSYPSGHSTYSGAASEILSYFFPDYAGEFDKLADNIGMARLWAGIHYRSDHIQGMKLGRCVARLIIHQIARGCIVRDDPCAAADPHCRDMPPTDDDLRRCAGQHCECCRKHHDQPPPLADRAEAEPATPPTRAARGGKRASSSGPEAEASRGPHEDPSPAGSPVEPADEATGHRDEPT